MPSSPLALPYANIEWRMGTPYSNDFQDFFFQTDCGLEETRYVFHQANNLNERLTACEEHSFCIAETGFGTGLNFFATWLLWKNLPEPKPKLQFLSCEAFPLRKEDLNLAISRWPAFRPLLFEFLQQYPEHVETTHVLSFEKGKLELMLTYGDASTYFFQRPFLADCWFLDGFAPRQNDSLWSNEIIAGIANHTKSMGTFATFTSVGAVRRSLEKAGFEVKKISGFGEKREMLLGHLAVKDKTTDTQLNYQAAIASWATPSHIKHGPNGSQALKHAKEKTNIEDYDVAIIGAGLAGLCTADAIARRGATVLLLDRGNAASEASGQAQLAMYAKFPRKPNKEARLFLQGMCYSANYFSHAQAKNPSHSFWHQTGLIQLAWNKEVKEKQHAFIKNFGDTSSLVKRLNNNEVSTLSNVATQKGGLYFPRAGWLDSKSFASHIIQNKRIDFRPKTNFLNAIYYDETQSWRLETEHINSSEQTHFKAKNIVYCTANQSKHMPSLSHLPIKPVRGQITKINSKQVPTIKTILCGESYLCPPISNEHYFGSTYVIGTTDLNLKNNEHLENIEKLTNWLPEWCESETLKETIIGGSSGLRCTTPDYFPIVGQLVNAEKFISDYAPLRANANHCKDALPPYLTNAYCNIGHGSKGMVTAPLAAEHIASLLFAEPSTYTFEQIEMLSTGRFLARDLIRKKI